MNFYLFVFSSTEIGEHITADRCLKFRASADSTRSTTASNIQIIVMGKRMVQWLPAGNKRTAGADSIIPVADPGPASSFCPLHYILLFLHTIAGLLLLHSVCYSPG